MSDRSSLTETKSIISKDHLSKFDERRPAGYPSDKEIPVVLVLKRKAIRVYPDNQKVVLYYSQALDKYVSIPFGPKSDVLGSPLNESRKPRKEKDDKDSTYAALAKKYPTIAAQYRKAKEEQPERRGLRKVVRKLTPKEIMNLPPEERKAAYSMAQQMASASDLPMSQKLGFKAGLATSNLIAKIKDRRKKKVKATTPTKKSSSTPSAKGAEVMPPSMGKTAVSTRPSVAESYKKKIDMLREERLDEVVPLIVGAGLRAGIGAAVRAGSAAWKARKAAQAAKKAAKAAKAAKGGKKLTARQRLRLAKRKHGGKLTAGATAATAGALGAMQAAGVTTSAEKEAQQNYQFTLDPSQRVSDPSRQRTTPDAYSMKVQRRAMGIEESINHSNIDKIKYIVENNINSYDMTFEGNDSTINLNNRVAKKVLQVYETLNTKNQKKFSKMLNENATTFKQAINFVIRH